MDAETLIERVARAIYENPEWHSNYHRHKPAWQDGGNSLRQDEARILARAALREIVAAAGVSPVAMIGHANDIERKWPGDKIAVLLRALAEGVA